MACKAQQWMSAWLLAGAALLVLPCDVATAHSVAKSRQPAPHSRLSVPPKSIKIEFGDGIEAEFSEISVIDQNGVTVAQGKGSSICTAKACALELPSLSPGIYTVSHSVLSRDGHVVKGEYEFTVTGNVP